MKTLMYQRKRGGERSLSNGSADTFTLIKSLLFTYQKIKSLLFKISLSNKKFAFCVYTRIKSGNGFLSLILRNFYLLFGFEMLFGLLIFSLGLKGFLLQSSMFKGGHPRLRDRNCRLKLIG